VTFEHQFSNISTELLNCNDDRATSVSSVKGNRRPGLGQTFWQFLLCDAFLCGDCILRPCVADIQEFYELTLLDDTKSIQQKTAETIRIANKWEATDGPITPTYGNNDVSHMIY
jgi:hypothetical protein